MKHTNTRKQADEEPLICPSLLKTWICRLFLIVLALAVNTKSTLAQKLLNVVSGKHYFNDNNGKPVLWQGDTQWEMFHVMSPSEAKTLMVERKKQGFNVIQVMATGVFPEWGQRHGLDFIPKQEAWISRDPSQPNEQYFSRVDSIVRASAQLDVTLVIGVFHAQDIEKGRINLKNIRPWATWLASRYKNVTNIIWSMYPHADSASVAYVQLAAQGLQEGDGNAHYITIHPDPSPKSSSFLHQLPWLAFNTLQTWSNEKINYDMVMKDYKLMPVKPVINGEARYEAEDGTTALQTRRAGYWSYLAGGYYTYGHRDNWRSPQTWRSWYNSPGAQAMKIMGEIFRSLEWWKLLPDTTLLTEPSHEAVAAISFDKQWMLIYYPKPGEVTVNVNKLRTTTVSATWINPATGKRSVILTISATKPLAFSPPQDWQDALLLIK